MAEHAHDQTSPLQGYFDWQVTTLMLARDLADPIRPGDETAATNRRAEMEHEVRDLTLAIVPDELKRDPNREWPPELMREITALTIHRAQQWVNQAGDSRTQTEE